MDTYVPTSWLRDESVKSVQPNAVQSLFNCDPCNPSAAIVKNSEQGFWDHFFLRQSGLEIDDLCHQISHFYRPNTTLKKKKGYNMVDPPEGGQEEETF